VSDAREEILRRIRSALRDVPVGEQPSDVAVTRDYRRADQRPPEQLLELLAERLEDYHAHTRRIPSGGDIASAVGEICEQSRLRRLAVPPSIPSEWLPAGIEVVRDGGLSAHELDSIGATLTGCAAAIAETGTIVLDGAGTCGRRALTLVPDHHICVVDSSRVVGLVPEGLERVAPAVLERRLPITLVSGPSATSDIELSRVEGVHGPRHLYVLLVG
jgi:L-lactate dehydrogenase complex protein LldG